MTREDTIPVIIGTAQLVDRDADLDRHIEPLAMLRQVAREAAEDAGIGNPGLQRLDTVALTAIAGWDARNPVDLLASTLDAHPRRQYLTGDGGQVGVGLLNHVAGDILRGDTDLALVAGCNNLRVLSRAAAAGRMPEWTRGGRGEPRRLWLGDRGHNDLEAQYGLDWPSFIYPLFENALRARWGLDPDTHRRRMGELFTRFTEVAANNPYAWFPVRRSAAELVTESADNRMIAFPYTKYLNAVLNTDQAAALLVCSASTARRLGVPEERWVYWHGGAATQERAWWVSERPDFGRCPAMLDCHSSALRNARVSLSEIDRFDFYSCFPVAVEMALDMLGLKADDPRGFTVTGGLPYAGGPASAYTLHSLAQMTVQLRDRRGERGLVTGNGWYLTKHTAAVLASAPPACLPSEAGTVEPLPSAKLETAPVAVNPAAGGRGKIETYTVIYDREGFPARGIVLGRTEEGDRFIANTPGERGLLERFVAREQIGRSGRLQQQDGHTLFTPE